MQSRPSKQAGFLIFSKKAEIRLEASLRRGIFIPGEER